MRQSSNGHLREREHLPCSSLPCRHCRDDMGFNLSWDEQGTMHLSFTTSVVRKDPVTGQDMWFNSAVSVICV